MLALEITDLTFTYRGRDRPALKNINLALGEGRTLAALGHTGAGKTTLLNTACAVVPAVKKGHLTGEVKVCGQTLAGARPADLAGKVAVIFDDFDAALVATTVEAEIAFGPRYLGLPADEIGRRVDAALSACGIAHLRDRPVATLSGGQKQRVAVAAAVAAEAQLYLFDEATTDLDPAGKEELRRLVLDLAAKGRAVVLAENDGASALWCHEVALLSEGERLAVGDPLEILADEALCDKAGVAPLPFLKFFQKEGETYRLKPGVVFKQKAASGEAPAVTNGSPVLVAEGVTHLYKNGVKALDDFNLRVGAGEFVALIGANGGGKTTFAKIAAGIISPLKGKITVNGVPPNQMLPAQRARTVGYLFQNPDHQIFQPTVYDEVAFGLRQLGVDQRTADSKIAAALSAVGLAGAEGEDPFALPKGCRQRVALASVLALEPEILIMDEPTTGLDRREVTALMTKVADLNRAGTTVIFITHALDVAAAYARRLVVINEGRVIAEGPPAKIFAGVDVLAQAALRPPLAVELARAVGIQAVTPEGLTAALANAADL